jgi:hypothetical protein
LGEWCYGILGTRSTLADQFKAEQSAIFFVEENLLRPPSPQQTNGRKRKAKKAQLDSSDEEEEDAEVVQKKAVSFFFSAYVSEPDLSHLTLDSITDSCSEEKKCQHQAQLYQRFPPSYSRNWVFSRRGSTLRASSRKD